MKRNFGIAAVLVAGLFGCDVQKNDSDAKSLDNFARASATEAHQNQCNGNYALMEDLFSPEVEMINIHPAQGQKVEQIQAKVESALRAVPTEVQVAFFGLGGIVEVTPNAHEICSQKLTSEQKERVAEGGGRIKGCWKYQTDFYINDSNQYEEDKRVVIYVDTDVAAIEHALVRTFGYVLSQVLVKLDHKEGQTYLTQVAGDEQFNGAKEAVALAFLKDVANSDGKYSLAAYESLIGKGVLSADDLTRRTAWDALMQSDANSAKAFMDYVFAEAFDSTYCSDATRTTMKADFPGAAEAFAPVSEAITGLKSELKTVENIEQTAKIESAPADASAKPATTTAQGDEGFSPTKKRQSYALFGGRIFGGIARAIGAIGRGVIRVGAAVVRGAARVAGAVVRGAARVVKGALRIGAAVLRATGRVALGIFRGAVRVAAGVVRAGGAVIRLVARGALVVGRVIVRGTGAVIRGVFGAPEAFATEAGMVLDRGILDTDGDGIEESKDGCSNTPAGARVWTSGQWMGCAGGQFKDR